MFNVADKASGDDFLRFFQGLQIMNLSVTGCFLKSV